MFLINNINYKYSTNIVPMSNNMNDESLVEIAYFKEINFIHSF